MIKKRFYTILIYFWTLSILPAAAQPLSMDLPPSSVIQASSLVEIKAMDAPSLHVQNDMVGMGAETRWGKGVIIDPSGIIATNRHIIGNPLHIEVQLPDGKIYQAKLVRNGRTDVCLIKISSSHPLKIVALADASQINAGKTIVALTGGNAGGAEQQDGKILQVFNTLSSNKPAILEMNVPIHPGDSGGAILNSNGSLVGLLMARQKSDPSKSYAIAANIIQEEYLHYRQSS